MYTGEGAAHKTWNQNKSEVRSRDPVWPDLATFRPFDNVLQVLGNILTVYSLFGKMLSLLWQICDIIGLIVAIGHILKHNLTIWSHENLILTWDLHVTKKLLTKTVGNSQKK